MIDKLNFSTTNDKVSVLSKYCCDMPYKYPEDKGWKITKQKYKLKNWSKYNNALKDRGRIDFWLDKEAIDKLVRRRSGEYWIWGSYAIH